jgi:hypothetical protein
MARVCVVFLLAGTVWIGAAPAQQSEGERRILTNGRLSFSVARANRR